MSEPKTLTVFSALGVQAPLEILIASFEHQSGVRIEATFEPTAVLEGMIADGAEPDVVLCTATAMDGLVTRGRIDPVSALLLVRSAIGVATVAGGVHPDISDVPYLTDALVTARAVAYSRSGASGQYFSRLLQSLGIADVVNEHAVILDKGFVAEALLDGRASLAVQQLSELGSIPGVEIVGPLPEQVQQRIELSVGVGTHCTEHSAWLLREHLTSQAAVEAFRAARLEPAAILSVE